MRRQKNHVRFCVIPILTYLTFLLLFLGFLQYMALGDDLIWLCLNLPEKILNDEKIDIYNYGDLERDFTYIDDLVDGIYKLVSISPEKDLQNQIVDDSLSNLAPYRIVNIGNSKPINLLKYIEVLEKILELKLKI